MVAKVLRSMNFPVYDSDKSAKELYFKNPKLLQSLVKEFGASIVNSEGLFQPANLASLVFNDTEKLKKLNQIVHPAVKLDFEEWMTSQSSHDIIFKEAAILMESGAYKSCTKVWLVTAPIELRIKRAMLRDGSSQEQVNARMSRQWTDEQRIPFVDFVINNNEEELLLPQIEKGLAELQHANQ